MKFLYENEVASVNEIDQSFLSDVFLRWPRVASGAIFTASSK